MTDGQPVCIELGTRRATRELGQVLASHLTAGDAVVLTGALGAGKTFLVRATCRALGLQRSIRVVSPTFTLVRELPTVPPVAHVDLYRLQASEDAEELGLGELRDRGYVLIVEWGERHVAAIGPDTLSLSILLQPRRAVLTANGPRSVRLLAALRARQ